MKKYYDITLEKEEQIARGKRIRSIRENELKLSKSDLAFQIGISSQFLGLVEEGKGNLMYRSLKLLRDLSGHSADYILFGLDDSVLYNTKQYLEYFTEDEIRDGLSILTDLTYLLKNKKYYEKDVL